MQHRGLRDTTIRLKLVSPKYLAASRGIRLDYKLPRRVARQPDTLNPLKAWGLPEACTTIRDRATVAVLL
ncbi:hypothetical protein Mtc_1887 [Methanocella conradii HZ254]|uniref:Uncharacterized protein n=1 Tax=Methanocella conradii (strain DSM 24694 / JCM 17849 / CGMCC 1.5162 / HZ254) TaxID=1041930 RepID=H8I4N2_METCZ|nr:hypothetical protein [Methanocella conradii]AFD00627.1 hypothetical protein Mtc_1887 [Methanocella conradii HZ254]